MEKKPLIGVSICAVVLLVLGSLSNVVAYQAQDIEKPIPTSRGDWLYVGGSGPGNYTKIQDAINASSDGDIIYVYAAFSPYIENININKSLTIIGEDKTNTIIDGNYSGNIITITANNTTVKGFSIRHSGSSDNPYKDFINGIKVWSNNVILQDNYLSNNENGIYCESVSKIHILNNTITNSSTFGIFFNISSNHNEVNNNTLTNYSSGVFLRYSANNLIQNNIMFDGNQEGINIFFSHSTQVLNNTICGHKHQGISISDECINNTIINNKITENQMWGIWAEASSNNKIESNLITENNWSGIQIEDHCNNNLISNNIFKNNSLYGGIRIGSTCDHNMIVHNLFQDNEYGIRVESLPQEHPKNNSIFHNNFINNADSAYDSGYNHNDSWNATLLEGGNYWSDYQGSDVDVDGIGDTPYNISGGNNQDHYPLMLPYGMTNLSIRIQPKNFKLLIFIKNIGNTTAFEVKWNISISGFVLFGKELSGFALKPVLPETEFLYISNKLFIGLGRIEISATAWADNAPVVTEKMNGILILWFFRIIER